MTRLSLAALVLSASLVSQSQGQSSDRPLSTMTRWDKNRPKGPPIYSSTASPTGSKKGVTPRHLAGTRWYSHGEGGDIQTRERYGDFQLHVEFNVPYMPDAQGQAPRQQRRLSCGLYELQILDSYGLKLQDNDCGAIYKQIIPSVNACKPPLQWQTYDITFHAAKVEDGKASRRLA